VITISKEEQDLFMAQLQKLATKTNIDSAVPTPSNERQRHRVTASLQELKKSAERLNFTWSTPMTSKKRAQERQLVEESRVALDEMHVAAAGATEVLVDTDDDEDDDNDSGGSGVDDDEGGTSLGSGGLTRISEEDVTQLMMMGRMEAGGAAIAAAIVREAEEQARLLGQQEPGGGVVGDAAVVGAVDAEETAAAAVAAASAPGKGKRGKSAAAAAAAAAAATTPSQAADDADPPVQFSLALQPELKAVPPPSTPGAPEPAASATEGAEPAPELPPLKTDFFGNVYDEYGMSRDAKLRLQEALGGLEDLEGFAELSTASTCPKCHAPADEEELQKHHGTCSICRAEVMVHVDAFPHAIHSPHYPVFLRRCCGPTTT
jgi:hypothetical protein